MKYIKNLIGAFIRDLVVYLEDDYVEYYYEDGMYVYMWPLKYSFTIGDYKFLEDKNYHKNN